MLDSPVVVLIRLGALVERKMIPGEDLKEGATLVGTTAGVMPGRLKHGVGTVTVTVNKERGAVQPVGVVVGD